MSGTVMGRTSMTFNAESTTDEVLHNIDLRNKTAVVTGASGGLGAETARALASKGASVILAARDTEKLQQRVDEIKGSTGNPNISMIKLDLADLNQVRQAATDLLNNTPEIHILINNAGVMATPLQRTQQNFEMQFGVNHMGHFLWTTLLIPALKKAAPSRVVVLSSGGHKYRNVNLDDPAWQHTEYNKWAAYGAAKSANALFAVALTEKYQDQGITANAVHPGVIFTDLGRHLTEEDIKFLTGSKPEGGARGKLVMKSVEQGAATSVWAATSPALENKGGLYLEDCQIGVEVEHGVQEHGYYSYILDKTTANALWEKSDALLQC